MSAIEIVEKRACSHCEQDIDAIAIACPYCGVRQKRVPAYRVKAGKFVWIGLLLALLAWVAGLKNWLGYEPKIHRETSAGTNFPPGDGTISHRSNPIGQDLPTTPVPQTRPSLSSSLSQYAPDESCPSMQDNDCPQPPADSLGAPVQGALFLFEHVAGGYCGVRICTQSASPHSDDFAFQPEN